MRRLSGALLGCSLLAASHAGATPQTGYGFGARATALGGAVTADPGDAGCLFYNPAQLSLLPRSELSLGYRAVSQALETNHDDAELPGHTSLQGAVAGRGSFLGVPVGFGLGMSLTNGHLSHTESVRAFQPRWVLRETLPELLELAAGLAIRPTPWLALGVGSGFLATTRGSFRVTGNAAYADGHGSEYDSQLRHAVDADLESSRHLLLGVQVALPLGLAVAAAFRDEASLTQDLRGTLQGNVDASFLQVPVQYGFETHQLVAFVPRQIVLGISAAREAWRLSVDGGFEQWSRYPSPVARSAAQLDAQVPAGLPLALPPSTQLSPAKSSGFHDRVTLRSGLARELSLSSVTTFVLRAGYAYLPSPAPKIENNATLLDAHEHVFSLGAGLNLLGAARYLPQAVRLDSYALYGHLPNRRLLRRDYVYFGTGHTWSAGLTLSLGF